VVYSSCTHGGPEMVEPFCAKTDVAVASRTAAVRSFMLEELVSNTVEDEKLNRYCLTCYSTYHQVQLDLDGSRLFLIHLPSTPPWSRCFVCIECGDSSIVHRPYSHVQNQERA